MEDLAAVRQTRQVDRPCEQYAHDLAALDPVLATHLGVTADDAALTDLSPEGWQEREDYSRRPEQAVAAAALADRHEGLARSAFLESDLPPDGFQQLLTENHTIKALARQLAQDNRRASKTLGRRPRQQPLPRQTSRAPGGGAR